MTQSDENATGETGADVPEPTVMRPVVPAPRAESLPDDVVATDLRLDWSALSDVGRVRKDNQDSGYAGAHLLVVCDGVGGAARGDIASSTAVRALRRLDDADTAPRSGAEGLERVAGAIQRATDLIGELAEQDEALQGTSTTATVALFDGGSIHVGHVGDSRAYLLRDGVLTQLTHDHTFVQSLVDEGRITEAEARVHPHRNLILKAVDGVRDPEPDLFSVALRPGDRLLLCSDGACGVLDDPTLAGHLSDGTPDFAAVELVRASLEAGSSDNVTCVVADVVSSDVDVTRGLMPLLVGAAAEEPRPSAPASDTAARAAVAAPVTASTAAVTADDASSSTVPAVTSESVDEELVRYAPREPRRFDWLKRIFIAFALLGLVWVAVVAAWSWSQKQFYVGEHEGAVTIFRGVEASLPGIDLSQPYETSNVMVADLAQYDADLVLDGISAPDLATARDTVDSLGTKRVQ